MGWGGNWNGGGTILGTLPPNSSVSPINPPWFGLGGRESETGGGEEGRGVGWGLEGGWDLGWGGAQY